MGEQQDRTIQVPASLLKRLAQAYSNYVDATAPIVAQSAVLLSRARSDMTAMSHETTGFCFCGQMHGQVKDWNEHDWEALREYMPAVRPGPASSG